MSTSATVDFGPLFAAPAYPAWLRSRTLDLLRGLGNPPLPERGGRLVITEHIYHPSQVYTIHVNKYGDIDITNGRDGMACGYCHNENPDRGPRRRSDPA